MKPTVMIGSLFYEGERILASAKEGRFDKKRARELLETQKELADKTGNPCMVDLVISYPEAASSLIDFTAEATNAPLLLDSTSAESRVAALNHACEIGIIDRVIYNSLLPKPNTMELEAIRDCNLKQAVLLAFDEKLASSQGRIDVIMDSEGGGLYNLAKQWGIEKPLIDTVVLDVPSLGMASRAIYELKEKYGMVCGCGAHNSIATWKGLKRKFKPGLRLIANTASAIVTVTAGADFVLYGPIEDAETVFPMIGMADAALGQLAFEETGKVDLTYPLFRIA